MGATGAVGHQLLYLLSERTFPYKEIRVFASTQSVGRQINVRGQVWTVEALSAEVFESMDFAIFTAGSQVSKEWAAVAQERGCLVIDNSAAFRMTSEVPLIIPEINGKELRKVLLIANPNCSTIIALMGLYPLHRAFGLKRFFASTYQAVSGSGAAAMEELKKQVRDWSAERVMQSKVYPHPIAFNVIPHVGQFLPDGYTKEEKKMEEESRKILHLPDLKVSSTCVRVPVFRAHSIAIEAEFSRPVDLSIAKECIAAFCGVALHDEVADYPMPLQYVEQTSCGIGRLRCSSALENGLVFWVVGDQLWKGAALNAIQIAELLHKNGRLSRR